MRVRTSMLAVLAAALVAAVPASALKPRQFGTFRFTSTIPGAPTGNLLNVTFQNPSDPDAKPYSAAQMVIHAPKGTVTDTTWLPQCHATDDEIYAQGASACPVNTKVGAGWAFADTGGSGKGRYSRTTITDFNNRNEVVGIGQNDDVAALRTIDRTKLEKGKSTSTFPAFPGTPPPEPYTPVQRLHIFFPVHKRNGRAYTRTPPTCPRSRRWTFKVDFHYRDGKTQSIVSRSPCRRKKP